MIKIRVKIHKSKIEKNRYQSNKVMFWERLTNINNIDLDWLRKNKIKALTKVKNESGDITTNTTEI